MLNETLLSRKCRLIVAPSVSGGIVQNVQMFVTDEHYVQMSKMFVETENRCAKEVSIGSEMRLCCSTVRIGRWFQIIPLRERALHRNILHRGCPIVQNVFTVCQFCQNWQERRFWQKRHTMATQSCTLVSKMSVMCVQNASQDRWE